MTNDQLTAMGFPVAQTDKVMGTVVVVRPGMSRQKAVHAAWAAGKVRVGGPAWVCPERVDTFDHDMFAWMMANKVTQ